MLNIPGSLISGAPVSKLYSGASRSGLKFACTILSGCVHANVYRSRRAGTLVSGGRGTGLFGLRLVPDCGPGVWRGRWIREGACSFWLVVFLLCF